MERKKQQTRFREIAAYIKTLEFRKKTIGGCDEEDVFQQIQEICRMYEDVIRRMEEEYEKKSSELIGSMSQIRDYREHTLQKAREEAGAMMAKVREEIKSEEENLERLRKASGEQIERLHKENEAYCKKIKSILEQIEALDHEEET